MSVAVRPSIDEQVETLMQGTEYGDPHTKAVMAQELRERLIESEKTGRPLRVYCGYDPRTTDLHLGHTITMRKLRQFQDLGHDVTFLIGTFTSLIGDPSDKDSAREQLTPETVRLNAETYAQQAFKILDPARTRVRYNDEWLSKLNFADIIQLASNFTVQQFLARDNFRLRYEAGQAIHLHEFFYALMQAYDAVAQETDVQVGGQDQLFNIVVAGRKLQQALGQRPQVAIIMGESLPGTDGVIKMSKSLGNHIPIMAPPEDMYGKVMSVPDHAMPIYHKLVLGWSPSRISQLEADLASGRVHPRDVKMALAREIVTIFHSAEAAQAAEEDFIRKFQERGIPDDLPVERLGSPERIVDLLERLGMAPSKGEAKRLIKNGGVRLNGEPVDDVSVEITPDDLPVVLQVGKRKFVRLEKA
ncbi:MAG: tyrosine--tRNA ligase [Anaerolineae bacterium]|nr:tyrosine--tRNA ligase [Anaerolineae bacterium]